MSAYCVKHEKICKKLKLVLDITKKLCYYNQAFFLCNAFNGVWLSLVERYVRDVEAAGSNPVTPTTKRLLKTMDIVFRSLFFLIGNCVVRRMYIECEALFFI